MGWAVEPYLNMGLTFLITVVIAALSWNFIEKPAIKLKDSALVARLAALLPVRLLR
jgi:peptidoglycan/LPS O-acetylase OafA/YrhL